MENAGLQVTFWQTYGLWIIGGGLALLATWIICSLRVIRDGYYGVKLFLGKPVRNVYHGVKTYSPGLVFMWPFQELHQIYVRQRTTELVEQEVKIKDGLIFRVSAVLVYKISSPYNAMFQVDNLEAAVEAVAMTVVREIFTPLTHSEIGDISGINKKMLEAVQIKVKDWGVKVVALRLGNCAPTPETSNVLVAQEGAKQRVAALQMAAKVLKVQVTELNSTLAAAIIGTPIMAAVTNPAESKPPVGYTKK